MRDEKLLPRWQWMVTGLILMLLGVLAGGLSTSTLLFSWVICLSIAAPGMMTFLVGMLRPDLCKLGILRVIRIGFWISFALLSAFLLGEWLIPLNWLKWVVVAASGMITGAYVNRRCLLPR